MARGIAGILGGLVVWLLVATIGNLALRMAWPDYAEVEKAMTFTLAMLVGRLILSAIASLCAGWTAAWIAKRNYRFANVLAGVLVVLFIPVHYNLWDKFPLWYHVVFFASLGGLTLWGARLRGRGTSPDEGDASQPVLPGPDDSH